jgi:hypothetical protein
MRHSRTLLALLAASCAAAQSGETLWAAVVIARHGERIPLLQPGPDALTPLGALQAQHAGAITRARYISTDSPSGDNEAGVKPGPIFGIDPDVIDSDQLSFEAPQDEVIVSSAQAFIQGLYPPLVNTSTSSVGRFNNSALYNGTSLLNPLGGYQYPFLETATSDDPLISRIWGSIGCQPYLNFQTQYYETSLFSNRAAQVQPVYDNFRDDLFNGIIQSNAIGYENAFALFDYANYAYNHNGTVRSFLTSDNLTALRILSNEQQWEFNGNITGDDNSNSNSLRAVAGQTLAYTILGYLATAIETRGADDKLNLIFTSHEPFLGFFALADLPNVSDDFTGMPEYGSTMAFELFSPGELTTMPATSDLYVRFMFRNGSQLLDELTPPVEYPIFNRGQSSNDMSWADFLSAMTNIQLSAPAGWCTACNSDSVFCYAYVDEYILCPATVETKKGLAPAVAGVIGAVVTLAVVGLAFAFAIFAGGMRFYRNRNTAQMGGFKGAEKMASDADLSLTKSAVLPAGATVVGTEAPRGHERVGSWEMKDGKNVQAANPQSLGATIAQSEPPRNSFQRASFESEELGHNPAPKGHFD